MSFRWSFSTDRDFRRCQRQFFFKHIGASHAPTEGWRREAFILRQLKTLELWRGTIIHEGVQHYVVPALKKGNPLNWKELTEQTLRRAEEQLAFSEAKRYRQPGITKGKEENFCALVPHETGQGVSAQELKGVWEEVRTAFGRLAELSDLWQELLGRKDCLPEKQLWVKFDDISILAQLDLVFERKLGRPTIIDWKSYEVGGDTDARLQTALYGWALWQSNFYDISAPENIELLECQLVDGVVIKHECSQEVFDEVEDYIYRSLHRIFSLCRSKKLSEAKLEDFAFTDNPNNCEHCAFRGLCIERALGSLVDVLRRDGRLFEAEWLGFEDAIKKLVDEGALPREIVTGAVEVPKHQSFGIRLVERVNHSLENPRLGSWEKLSESEGIVCTTGWPFDIPGTAEPLVVRVARGSLDIEHVLEDTFGSSQLCWPTPAGCMRLPIELKLCDEHLRAYAGKADEDSALFDEVAENEEEEPLLSAAK